MERADTYEMILTRGSGELVESRRVEKKLMPPSPWRGGFLAR